MLNQLLQALLVLFGLTGAPQAPIHLPGPEYHWTALGAWAAANMKADLGFDCGKLVWLPDPAKHDLTPQKILWEASDPNDEIPQHILESYPQVIVSVALTKECPIRGPPAALVASPAILLKSSSSPWTVDATYNHLSSTIYAVGPGGNGANAVANTSSGGGGGAGAAVFVNNYNNSWTPGTSTATFQITGGNAGAEGLSTANTTFDSSAFIARAGGAGVNNAKGTGGSATSSTVPTGGTKHKGGDGGIGQASTNKSGGAGGGAAGTTGDGANGGDSAASSAGAPGGGGADNGTAGTTATGSAGPGFAGGHSGLGGSTGGAGGIMGTSLPTSGTLGAGGGGGAAGNNNNTPTGVHTGADGSSGGTQFDATHGAGGGGGGGGGGSGTFTANGGKGGNYGGGAGGGGVSGTSFAYSGGTAGDGIVFITWTPAASGVIYSPMTPMTGGGRITVLEWIGRAVNDNVMSWLEAS